MMKFSNIFTPWTAAVVVIVLCWPGASTTHGGHDPDALTSYTVTPERVKLSFEVSEKITLIDLRPLKDFQKQRLPGARSIPAAELEKRFGEIPKIGRVILYCDCSVQEIEKAYVSLESKGYKNINLMEEGFSGWLKRKYPLEGRRP
jgi:rhodanese-related sulfurtransferase